jgi:hypothetical protein
MTMDVPHEDKMSEAIRIIDVAAARGVVLRLLGGIAIRVHCEMVNFCERDYSDIDLVGLSRQRNEIVEVFEEVGYAPDVQFNALYGTKRLIFDHPAGEHIDVFLDHFAMEHDLDFSERLQIEKYTLPLSDLLLTKLQIHSINEKDIRDSITILKDCDIGEEDKPAIINIEYIAEKCSEDWGLFEAILENCDRILEHVGDYILTEEERERIFGRVTELKKRLLVHPKTLKWKLRALVGKHIKWYELVEGQEGKS